MPDKKVGRQTNTKGTSTARSNSHTEIMTSETESGWMSPSVLKQEVQTIIDIMGPPLMSNFNYNTSSEADNEESFYSNSKLSSEKQKKSTCCSFEELSEKNDSGGPPSKDDDANLSTAADLNTTISATLDDLTDPKVNFPYTDNPCICPPPLMPANICINSECFCPQVASILHGNGPQPNQFNYESRANYEKLAKVTKESKKTVLNWLKAIISTTSKSLDHEANKSISEYYKMNVKKRRGDDQSPPRRVVFELVEGLPQNLETSCNPLLDEAATLKNKKNVKNERLQTRAEIANSPGSRKSRKPVEKTTYCDPSGKTRVDVYYFDHGSFNHYETTDAPPLVTTEGVADLSEKHTTRFWAEIFGTVHIGFSFATSFVLQFFRFLLYSVCRPLTIGLIQLASDYFFKPLLATLFNGIIQPILILIYNVLSSIRDLCDPIAEGVGYFVKEIATLLRAFRIVEVGKANCKCQTECNCEKTCKSNRTLS